MIKPDGHASDDPRHVAHHRSRVAWVDIARGIGIVLVVYAHALRGLIAAGTYPATSTSALQDNVIYAFHMPLFFFLSGLFATRARAGQRGKFLVTRLRTIVYPYFLWSILQGVLAITMAHAVNHPTHWADLLRILWDPIGQFWFLYALFLCQLTLLLPGRYTLAAVTVLMLALSIHYGNLNMVIRSGKFLVFFAVGVYLTARRGSALLAVRPRALAIGLVAALLFALAYWAGRSGSAPVPPVVRYYALGLLGIAATSGISATIDRGGRLLGALGALGAASMPIYLVHVIVVAVFRAAMAEAHVPLAPVPLLLLATVVGLAVPYCGFLLARRLGLSEILGFGRASARLIATRDVQRDSLSFR